MKILLLLIPLLFIIGFSPAYGELLSTQEYTVNDGALFLYSFDFSPDGRNAYFFYGPSSGSIAQTILVHYTLPTAFDIGVLEELNRHTIPSTELSGWEYFLHCKNFR